MDVLIGGLAIIGAASLLRMLYTLVVPEPVDVLPDRLSEPIRDIGSDEFASVLAANLNVEITRGNRIEHYRNGDAFFPPMLEAIQSARSTVNLLTFIYWTGDIAEAFADALVDAARRGVKVRVLLDYIGCKRMSKDLVERMRQGGCHIAWFHKIKPYNLRRANHRTHRKVLVIDGRVGFTGGAGIANEWTGDARGPDEWRDDHYRIQGGAVRDLQGAFGENWRQATGEVIGPSLFPPLEDHGSALALPLFGTPGGTVSQIGFCYWFALQSAEQRVCIATPYFAPDPDVIDALAEAAGRGVNIQLLIPGDQNDYHVVRWAAQSYYRRLLEAGVQVYEFQPTMLHVKLVTVDGTWAIIGSANFDNRSLELNFEIALAVRDRTLLERLDASFAADLERAKQITLNDVREWSAFTRLRAWACYTLREQL